MKQARIALTPKGYTFEIKNGKRWQVPVYRNEYNERMTLQFPTRIDAQIACEKIFGTVKWMQ